MGIHSLDDNKQKKNGRGALENIEVAGVKREKRNKQTNKQTNQNRESKEKN